VAQLWRRREFLPVNLAANQTINFGLHWSDPSATVSPAHGAQSDLDVFVYDNAAVPNLLFQVTNNNTNADAVETFFITAGAAAATFNIRVGLHTGPAPAEIKLIEYDNGGGTGFGATPSNTNDGTIFGHSAAARGITVGAAYWNNTPAFGTSPPVVEAFSSGGPTRIL